MARASYVVTFGPGQCGEFASSATAGFSTTPCPSLTIDSGAVSGSAESEQFYKVTPPSGIVLVGAMPSFSVSSNTGSGGWGSGDFWQDAAGNYYGNSWNATGATEGSGTGESLPSSSYWAYQLTCASSCTGPASVTLSSVALTASESAGPSLSPPNGAANLYNRTSGWVWNPAGDPWPATVAATDVSGVCSYAASAGAVTESSPVTPQNDTQWQACPDGSWTANIDTNAALPKNGALTVTLSATNASGVTTSGSATVHVDNAPVTETLSTPNDANPAGWVNHAVTVDADTSAGPSGVSGTQCSIDGGSGSAYPSGGLTVNGDGVHTVTCTGSNNAVDPQGAENTGSATEQIGIDEVAPAVAFEPLDPSNPRQLVVDSSDGESGVASTTVTMQGAHQAAPMTLPATTSGGQTVATFPDAGKHGVYTFVATSCDNAGNCAATSGQLKLPIRLGSTVVASFNKIVAETTAKVKVRHLTVNGKRTKIRLVIKPGARCAKRTIKVAPHHSRTLRACRAPSPKVVTRRRFRYGARVKLHGVLETKQGAPVAGAPVVISTRPDKRGSAFHTVLTSTTDKRGVWTAKLPKGPDRVVKAHYAGSTDVEPATTKLVITSAAGIDTAFSAHRLRWSGTLDVSGRMASARGLPRKGLALLLQVRYPHSKGWTTLVATHTNKRGQFGFRYSYRSGRGTATYPFRVRYPFAQAGYPYAVGSSRPVKITFHR